MELREFLKTLWKHWWLIVLCTACAAGASFLASSILPPVYEARVLLMSDQLANAGFVDFDFLYGSQQLIATYQELLQTRSLLEAVIVSLNLPYSLEELEKNIEVSSVPDSQLLELKVEDTDPQRAADIANEIVLTFLVQRSTKQKLAEIEVHEQTLAAQIDDLVQMIERTEAEIAQVGTSGLLSQQELNQLKQTQSQNRSVYANLLSEYRNLRAIKLRSLDLVIAEPALRPIKPIRPQKLLYTAIAALSGCAIGCALIFLLEYLGDTLESVEDVRGALSMPTLGSIPDVKSWRSNSRARIQEGDWQVSEAFRMLQASVQFASERQESRTLAVTSSFPMEGKSSVIANLGIVMAQNGSKVILVDADLWQPRLHSIFGVPTQGGLASVLLNIANLQESIVQTDIPNLCLLPAGSVLPDPSGLIGSTRMTRLIKDLEALADTVLFDTPPVLVSADAMLLASQVDGVLLVIESRSTRRDAAKRAMERLRSIDARVLGTVLNRVPTRSSDHYYYTDGRKRRGHFGRRHRSKGTSTTKRAVDEKQTKVQDALAQSRYRTKECQVGSDSAETDLDDIVK